MLFMLYTFQCLYSTYYVQDLEILCYLFFYFGSEYVGELFDTLISTPRQELKAVENELDQETPAPMHRMLEKQDRAEAISKYKHRKNKETPICPPTCTGKTV